MFEIYGRNNCSYCEYAKKWITRKGFKYDFYNIEESQTALGMFKAAFPDAKTVPQVVFFDDKGRQEKIGGYAELVEWFKNRTD